MEEVGSGMIKLTSSNYSVWNTRMEDILYCKELFEPIERKDYKPVTTTEDEWKKLNRKTIGHIRQWVDQSVFHHVAKEVDTYSLCVAEHLSNFQGLLNELSTMKLELEKALKNKWVLKTKPEPNRSQPRYKTRLVVKGFSQKKGIDFEEIFSPVVKMSSIQVVLGLASSMNLEIEQLDVKIVFLHGDLEEEIYMEQPEGFTIKGNEHLVC
ncbi:Retrovirus-related Pol polyprotein from transposon TNT 1-94 [Vitis vinifera]|uniref:Retrovirus-related Pol polyprotein from transposon TNT 1-94 n=1 Tax=Vitis vinifera TaxID=29760 RepID=A0A438GGB5_VITVI|nr:Retrovirus-related Pol polyprotein from transposon TNT 1-94 [Vitis vinifera]